MNFGARFSEFGMTGAVFWICQILLLTIGAGQVEGADLLASLNKILGTEGNNSALLLSATGSLLTVFGLIAIFSTGLILDMMGSIFFMQEMRIFGSHISKNHDWLDKMTDKCSTVIAKDYRDFQKEFDDSDPSTKNTKILQFDPRIHLRRFALRFHFLRLQTFLLSYIHVYSANGMSDQLTDHVHVWRTARAISMALFIVALEVIAFDYYSHPGHTEVEAAHTNSTTALYIHWGLFAASALLTLKSYNRMCFSLFTLSCATNSHQTSSQ